MGPGSKPSEEDQLGLDPRWLAAVELFNAADWYAAHDGLEELWHESAGPMRPLLQGILQLAVAQLHLERGNQRGAVILLGEGLGRLRRCSDTALGLDLRMLRQAAAIHLQALQAGLHAAEAMPASALELPPLKLERPGCS